MSTIQTINKRHWHEPKTPSLEFTFSINWKTDQEQTANNNNGQWKTKCARLMEVIRNQNMKQEFQKNFFQKQQFRVQTILA